MTPNGIQYAKSIMKSYEIADVFNSGQGNDLLSMRLASASFGVNVLPPLGNDSFRQQLGFSLSDMLISCSYNFQPCYASDFDWMYNGIYGNGKT
jgi:hypothetical protein